MIYYSSIRMLSIVSRFNGQIIIFLIISLTISIYKSKYTYLYCISSNFAQCIFSCGIIDVSIFINKIIKYNIYNKKISNKSTVNLIIYKLLYTLYMYTFFLKIFCYFATNTSTCASIILQYIILQIYLLVI